MTRAAAKMGFVRKSRALAERARQWSREGNPILGREIRTLLRMRPVAVGLAAMPIICTGVALLISAEVLADPVGSIAPAARGTVILEVAAFAGFALITMLGAVLGAQSMAGERQARTLEPLLLTGMSPWQIVAGKVAAVWVALLLVVVSCLPPLGICFVLGGVSLAQLLAVAVLLLSAAVVPIAFGMWAATAISSPRLSLGLVVATAASAVPVLLVPFMLLSRLSGRSGDPSMVWWIDAVLLGGPTAAVFVPAVVVPAYAIICSSWLFLAGAVSTLTGSGSGKAKPLETWLAACLPAGAVVAFLVARLEPVGAHESVVLVGGLGSLLLLGAIAISAHRRPRAPRASLSSRVFGHGAPRGAFVASAVTVVTLLVYFVGVDADSSSSPVFSAGLVVVSFVVFIAGLGALLAGSLKPAPVRVVLVVLVVAAALVPLVLAFLMDLHDGGPQGDILAAVVLEASPLGAMARLYDEARHGGPDTSPIFAAVYLAVGLIGAFGAAHVARRKATAAELTR